MHTTFILFTGMSIESGGLGYDAKANGYIFAFVGLVGVLVQGGFMRSKLAQRLDSRKMMVFGILICGLGIGWIPYLNPTPFVIVLIPMAFIALGNGLFQPTQNTLLTLEAKSTSLDLGRVMGCSRRIWSNGSNHWSHRGRICVGGNCRQPRKMGLSHGTEFHASFIGNYLATYPSIIPPNER